MGFNLSGLAVNRNYENEFDSLATQLGWDLIKTSEIDFETASSNWKEDGTCDAYFSERGTLLFISIDRCTESLPLKNHNTMTFVLSETTMAFNLNYCEDGIEKRSIMEVNEERFRDEGERLEAEDRLGDTSEIIWNQMEVVTGKSFWEIEPDEKAVRYTFRNAGVSNANEGFNENKPVESFPGETDSYHNRERDAKKWWQFWK